ncbi:sensor histidine kinase [Yoonia sediminilitoris]|uniref:histidine kinase n=1 Tax=Yoonia sediminilitoris TaxID=1286148 RepID=A0A2T6KPW6_9RHOB|nr:sensor histidine kinase [Yoonia sediminilitoris]PUB18614.1 signal transduction histidine kinase [Yoonia sediminilitoris]RCW98782.1 signal transduction histidine kinase [Yoonia sediminilitoris]
MFDVVRRLRAALTCLLALAAFAAPAFADSFAVSPAKSEHDLTPALRYASGTAADPVDMVARYGQGAFSEVLEVSPYAANHAPEAWAAVELNATEIVAGRLVLNAPLVSEVDLYLAGDGPLENVLSYSVFRPFLAVQHTAGRLQSQPLALLPGERVLVLAHVKFGPLQQLDVRFEQADATAQKAVQSVALTAAFYAFALASILVFVALFAALRDWMSLLYALMFFVGLGLLAFLDGLLFRFLYPNTPGIQSAVGFFLLFTLAGSGFLLAGQGFRAGNRVIWARWCAVLAGLCGFGFAISLVSPGTYVAAAAYLLLALMCVAVLVATRITNATHASNFAVGRLFSFLALTGLMLLLVPLLVPALPQIVGSLSALKGVYLILVLGALANFVAKVLITRRTQEAATAAELAALAREAELNKALFTSEQNYATARAKAQERTRQLANASHDLRQPLMSLGMTVDSLAARVDPETRGQLREAFSYITSLSESYLDNATDAPPEQENERYEVGLILQTVQQMFQQEAAKKGLRLRMVTSTYQTRIPPMALMRITSNLVSNAIKYTDAGGVLMGLCRRGGMATLCVVDTGPGLSEEEFGRFQQEGEKGPTSDGHGLGLAVCFSLAQENGISLSMTAQPGHGTAFMLALEA